MTTIANHLQRLSLLLTADDVPEWIKSASVSDLDSADENDATAFADTARRQLPVHTKTATFFSSVIFGLNPQDYGIRQYPISSKLAQMCELHDIDQSEVKTTLSAIKQAENLETAADVSRKLASFSKAVASSTKNPASFVRAARHLQQKGVDDEFTRDWSFTRPRHGIKQTMLSLANSFGDEQSKKIARLASTSVHEAAQAMLPDVLDGIDMNQIGCQQIHSKLASLPILEEFDCRICDHDYPDATIRSKIGELAIATNLDLVGRFLSTPTAGYRERLQTAAPDVQRLAQSCL